jgi:hypothetical protein
MWTLPFGHHEDRTPTHGYEPTRKAAMEAFEKAGDASKGGASMKPESGSRSMQRSLARARFCSLLSLGSTQA